MRISCEVNLKNANIPLLLNKIVVRTPNDEYLSLTFEIAKSDYPYDDEIRAVGQYGTVMEECNEMPSWLNHFINRQGLITNMPGDYEIPDFDMYSYNEYPDGDDGDEDCVDQYREIYSDPDDIRSLDEAYDDAVKDYEKFIKKCFISSVTFDLDEDACFENDIDVVDISELDLSDVKVEDARISLGSFEFHTNANNDTKIYLN